MIPKTAAMAMALTASLPLPVTAGIPATAPVSPAHGVWLSPYGDMKVQTTACGGNLCGWVVWATPEAEQDARDGGVTKLVGTELLTGYRQTGVNRWQGRVFVPDMGRSYDSTITQVDPQALKISGCIMGGLICKTQVWRKV